MVVHLNSPGRAAVGVAVKPPDESFRRLETARPNPPLYLSLCVLYAALILGEGHDKQADRPGYLSSHTGYTLPRATTSWCNYIEDGQRFQNILCIFFFGKRCFSIHSANKKNVNEQGTF